MFDEIVLKTKQRQGLLLDPRTKMLLLITISTFLLGGLGSESFPFIVPCFSILPFILLISTGKIKKALIYALIFILAYLCGLYLLPKLSGLPGYLVLACTGMLVRFMPGLVLGSYVMSSTTVSEFTAGMEKIHLSDKIIIPLSVMFRFFPTLKEEFLSINAAMRMRGIIFVGGRIDKMIEYRLIPLVTCAAKIGEELSAAALTRGLGGEIKRTNLCEIGFKFQDVVLISLCAVAFLSTFLDYIGLL